MIIQIKDKGILAGEPAHLAAQYVAVGYGLMKILSKEMGEERAREMVKECHKLVMGEVKIEDE